MRPSPYVCVCVEIAPFCKDTSHIGLWAHLFQYALIGTDYIYDDLISKQGHSLRYQGLGHQHMNLEGYGGDTIQPITVREHL